VKKLLIAVLLLSGCGMLPSFYDDNESMLAVNVRYEVDRLDCDSPRVLRIKGSVDKLYFFTQSKGSNDVLKLVQLMKKTTDPMPEVMSTYFCNIKKSILEKQSRDIADAIMRRY
jgi:hypothetical protein|tara:strand:+ start:246 stop:587 length:342 start_codon:yes stop_codon:yes gene_type:complete